MLPAVQLLLTLLQSLSMISELLERNVVAQRLANSMHLTLTLVWIGTGDVSGNTAASCGVLLEVSTE